MLLCDAAQVADGKPLHTRWGVGGNDRAGSAVALGRCSEIDVDWHEAENVTRELGTLPGGCRRAAGAHGTPDGTQPVEVPRRVHGESAREIPEGSPIELALAVNLGPILWRLPPGSPGG